MGSRTETQSIESHVDPDAIVALLADPSRIPDWAPAFADAVTGDTQTGWRALKGGQAFALRVVAVKAAGTVDYLREIAPGREGGAYLRVLPRPGAGSVRPAFRPYLGKRPRLDRSAIAAGCGRGDAVSLTAGPGPAAHACPVRAAPPRPATTTGRGRWP